MSAIGGIVIEEGDLQERLPDFLEALAHEGAREIGLRAGGARRKAPSWEDLDLEGIETTWAIVHVAGPAPEPGSQPVQDEAGSLACCIEDSASASTLLEEAEDPEPPADRLVRRLAEELENTGEIGSALQRLASELDHVSALAAGSADGMALMRDAHGAVPLYAGRDEEAAAFATSKQPLWQLDMATHRIKPDTLVLLQPARSQTIHLPRRAPNPVPDESKPRLEAHADAFKAAVQRRVERLDTVGMMATHPTTAAALARALETIADKKVHAYVPDRENRKLNEAIDHSVAPHADEITHVPLQPWALENRIGDLLHALEARNQGLVADAIPPYVLSRAAASDGIEVLLADRGPTEPHAHEALEAAEDRSADEAPRSVPIGGEGPLERAHKLARRAGVTLRCPRADADVSPFEAPDEEGRSRTDHLARLAAHLGADPIEAPPVVEPENRDLQKLLADALEDLEVPAMPEAYDAAESLNQGGQGPATPGRALVALADAQGLDAVLQWTLDHAALEAHAVGPDEHQRLERYLEDVQAPRPAGAV